MAKTQLATDVLKSVKIQSSCAVHKLAFVYFASKRFVKLEENIPNSKERNFK